MLGSALIFSTVPSKFQVAGVTAVLAGSLLIAAHDGQHATSRALLFAVLTSVSIATYTLWDRYAVVDAGIAPVVLDWFSHLVRAAALTPLVVGNRAAIGEVWRAQRRNIIGIAILSPLSYILFLTAVAQAGSALLAPFRELSVVLGAILGVWLLNEQLSRRRVAGICLLCLGAALVALK